MPRPLFALDIETAALDQKMAAYAGLEPWRVLQKKAHITSISVANPDNKITSISRRKLGDRLFDEALPDLLHSLKGQIVYAHNAVFDLAWMLASTKETRISPVQSMFRDIRWMDSMLLAKWIVNGQHADDMHFSLSLVNLVQSFLPDHPLTAEFVKIKALGHGKQAFGDDDYWESRNVYDVILTRALAEFLEDKLPDTMRKGYSTEMRNLLPVANSWIVGIKVDQDRLAQVEASFEKEQAEILTRIQIAPSVLTSPKQLGHLLFEQLKIAPISYTPTNSPSTNADDLKLIAFKLKESGNAGLGSFMTDVVRYKQIATLKSKYINGAKAALQHTGDGHIYGAPRIFGTYTGRFTYSSKTQDTYQTGIAFHQIPRKDKAIRSILCPPDGCKGYEADASGQESRLMAIRSGDPVMLSIFAQGLDFHCITGANIAGMEYEEFHAKYISGDLVFVEKRQFGKLTNLSGNYRIGGAKLAKKAFDEYDLPLSISTGIFFINTFNRTYIGVPKYWEQAISFARVNKYTEAFGGRRYKIHDWSGGRIWQSESTALMTPIQGSGASQKNIAIAETFDKVPEALFCLDVHDASFFWVPNDIADECKQKLDQVLKDIDYSYYWGFTPPIPLPFESKMGTSLADLKG